MRRPLLLLPGLLLIGATAMASHGSHHHGNRSVTFNDDEYGVTDCSAMRVRFDGEPAAVVSESVPVGNVRLLRVNSDRNGGIRVVGSLSGTGFSVTACKAAAASVDLRQVQATLNGDQVSATGPDNQDWVVYFIVQTPRGASLDLTSSNGPISVYEFDGTLTARAQNGPLGIRDSSGTIDAATQNGPISISGGSGNVKLSATNGPLSVKLDGSGWNGSLNASTQNGPVTLRLPRGYQSGVVVESSGHGPVSCRAERCTETRTISDDEEDRPRRIELGAGPAAIHLSTVNGPVSIRDGE